MNASCVYCIRFYITEINNKHDTTLTISFGKVIPSIINQTKSKKTIASCLFLSLVDNKISVMSLLYAHTRDGIINNKFTKRRGLFAYLGLKSSIASYKVFLSHYRQVFHLNFTKKIISKKLKNKIRKKVLFVFAI